MRATHRVGRLVSASMTADEQRNGRPMASDRAAAVRATTLWNSPARAATPGWASSSPAGCGPVRIGRGVSHGQLQRAAADPAAVLDVANGQLHACEQVAARL